MAITAAIFDCDGTLVDSMAMWENTTLSLLYELGASKDLAWEIFVETEPDPLEYMCERWHSEWGLGESTSAIYAKLKERVAKSYAESCPVYEGVREMLRALKERQIPIACVSSTALPLLRIALGANGILHYFDHVISTGGDIPDKNNPDVWRIACKRLGSNPKTTWVFEDGPFSFRSAAKAGCPTVCIYTGTRDLEECKELSTKLIHSYLELSVDELEDYEACPEHFEGTFSALIVAGSPLKIQTERLQEFAKTADYIVAADSGIDSLYAAQITPDIYVGDLDSANPKASSWAKDVAKRFITSTPYKYATDFKMALLAVQNEANRRCVHPKLLVVNATGGRQDHALAVLGNLKDHADMSPQMFDPDYVVYIVDSKVDGTLELHDLMPKTTISICALTECDVTTKGLEWDVDTMHFYPFSEQSISNLSKAKDATISISNGAAAIYVLNN